MFWRLSLLLVMALAGAAVWLLLLRPTTPVLRLGSTTSTRDSGLLEHLIPLYEGETGIEVVVLAKGTGAAIRDGIEGRVDALLVHNQAREEALVAEGVATARLPLMSNDFLLVGDVAQPPYSTLDHALSDLLSGERGLFLSRGDGSGTHAAELAIWARQGLDPETFANWYVRTGTGMGPTLITANARAAATLVDSATWAKHGDREALAVWYSGPGMENPYGYLPLNPAHVPGVQADLANAFGDWLTGPTGQAAISAYTIDGQQAFRPHAPSPSTNP